VCQQRLGRRQLAVKAMAASPIAAPCWPKLPGGGSSAAACRRTAWGPACILLALSSLLVWVSWAQQDVTRQHRQPPPLCLPGTRDTLAAMSRWGGAAAALSRARCRGHSMLTRGMLLLPLRATQRRAALAAPWGNKAAWDRTAAIPVQVRWHSALAVAHYARLAPCTVPARTRHTLPPPPPTHTHTTHTQLWQTSRSKQLTARSADLQATWRMLNPGMRMTLMDDAESAAFIRDWFGAEVAAVYEGYPLAVMRADFWRYAGAVWCGAWCVACGACRPLPHRQLPCRY
jgi:hypothetical protein